MKTLRLVLLYTLVLLSPLFLSGCTESPYPLGPPEEAPMYPELAGVWELVDESADEHITATILPFNEHEYFIEYTSQDLPDGEIEIARLRGFITPVDGSNFANIQFLEEEERSYLICTIDFSETDALVVGCLDDELLEDMTSSEELFALIKDRLEKNDLGKIEVARFERKKE